jgi:hypothetical protein
LVRIKVTSANFFSGVSASDYRFKSD